MVQKTSMRATLTQMKPGEVVGISIHERKYNYIRNCGTNLGVALGRKYSARFDREAGVVYVTRTA